MNRAAITALLLIFCLADIAAAQNRNPPGVPARRGKNDGLRMVPKDKPEKPKKDPEEEAKKAEPKDPVEVSLARLAAWPSADAREAAAALAIHGPEIEPRLLALLPDAEPPLAAGISFVLGDVGGDASLAAVQRLAARPNMAEYLPIVFDALGRLDGVNAVRRVLPFLRHPRRVAREAAEVWLRDRLNASFTDRLEAFLGDTSRGARLSALRLLHRISPERARERSFELLGDDAPEVCRMAAEVLSASTDRENLLQLNEVVGGVDTRKVAYAVLALVLVEAHSGERGISRESITHLTGVRGLRSPQKLNRAAAAVALADIGYDSEIPEIDALLDGQVVLTLLDSLGGQKFYKDYNTFAELARDRFGKLTGVRDRRPIPELWKWWEENREGFVANRALREIRLDEISVFRVRARSSVEPALPTILLSTVPGDAQGPDAVGVDFYYLLPATAHRLAALVSRELFKMPDSGIGGTSPVLGAEGDRDGLGPDVIVSVSLEKRSRTAVVRGSNVPGPLLLVLNELRAIRQELVWQRYWDRDTYPRYDEFIRVESEFFGGNPSREERDARLKSLVLSSLDDLPTGTERLEAVGTLKRVAATLTDSEAYRLALLLEEEAGLTPFSERLVTVLAGARKQLVLPVVAGWFERHPGTRSLELFVSVLTGLPETELRRAAGSERVFLRRAAIRAASSVLEGDALRALLVERVADASAWVRREAFLAVGKSRVDGALSILVSGLEEQDVEVRNAVVEGLGLLGGPEVVPVLAGELESEDLARRVGAIRALCETRVEDALPPVLSALTGDDSQLVRGVASREVVRFGLPALGGLSQIVTDTEQSPSVRARALESLVRVGGDHVVDILAALLEDPEDEVADGAAYALAVRSSRVAVPRLLDALEKGRNPVQTLAALEKISSQTFPTARQDELPVIYRGWWNENKTRSEWEWFVASLDARGYDTKGIRTLVAERPPEAALPVLIRALGDGSWFVRANANLWLVRATGENFGDVTRFTLEEDVREVQAKWRAFRESR